MKIKTGGAGLSAKGKYSALAIADIGEDLPLKAIERQVGVR